MGEEGVSKRQTVEKRGNREMAKNLAVGGKGRGQTEP